MSDHPCVADRRHCLYCFDVLCTALELQRAQADPAAATLPGHADSVAVFVSWHKDGRLRGCIGTFQARPLAEALQVYAIQAAQHDTRFPPIAPHELPSLECTVSLLAPCEPCRDMCDWDVGVHGVHVSLDTGAETLTATFLPHIAAAQRWTKEQTIEHALRKAGWTRAITPSVLARVRVKRYTSTTASATYAEYEQYSTCT